MSGPMWQLTLFLITLGLLTPAFVRGEATSPPATSGAVLEAQKLIGLEFSESKINMMLPDLKEQLANFQKIRSFTLSNSVPPAFLFNPIPVGLKLERHHRKFRSSAAPKTKMPANLD